MNTKAITKRLTASRLIACVDQVAGGLEVVATADATGQQGSTDRIHALITSTVRDCGGYSRQVSSSEERFTAEGGSVWRIAA